MRKKLPSYMGFLSAEMVAKGMNLALENAKRLFADAELLFANGRYPSEAALAILSIEEAGKTSILRQLGNADTTTKAVSAWKAYRSHTQKNAMWAILQHVKRDRPTRLADLMPLFDDKSDHPYILDQLKQISFYTDCLANAHWSSPPEVIDKDLTETLLLAAKVLCGREEPFTAREIELWQLHVGPVENDVHASKGGVVAWYAAMQKEGLRPEGRNLMEQFRNQGLGPAQSDS